MHGRHDPDRGVPLSAVWGSLGMHGAMLAVFVWLSVTSTPPLTAQTYQVRLIAAADLQAPLRDTPAPPRQAEEVNRPPPPQPTEDPVPETELPSIVEEIPQVEEPVREPARADETGDASLSVQTEGARFVDPAYANNIVDQINRYWRPPDTSRPLQAEIIFVIDRTGKVSDVKWLRRSGDATFDLEARGAIEAAARADAFGPLPDAFPFDQLQVSFYFDPSSR
ncbi:MAG: TonB C-terminal domain-containing protein [Gemmatimonadota bacterium]|nr:TonB C-terminal domain-containing protein [Gemmatimonadota bacterium]